MSCWWWTAGGQRDPHPTHSSPPLPIAPYPSPSLPTSLLSSPRPPTSQPCPQPTPPLRLGLGPCAEFGVSGDDSANTETAVQPQITVTSSGGEHTAVKVRELPAIAHKGQARTVWVLSRQRCKSMALAQFCKPVTPFLGFLSVPQRGTTSRAVRTECSPHLRGPLPGLWKLRSPLLPSGPADSAS